MNEDIINSIVEEVLKKIKTVENKQKIYILGNISPQLESVLKSNFDIKQKITDSDFILIAEIGLGLLSRLSNCIPIDEIEEEIITALLKNKNVFILKGGICLSNYKSTKRKNLYNVLIGFQEKLELLGFQIIEDITEISGDTILNGNDSITFNKKIVTERDLINNKNKLVSVLKIPRHTLITPLAEDFLVKNNIKVVRFEG